MHPFKAAVPLALAVGLVAASSAAADSAGTAVHAARAPVAHVMGGSAGPPIYPGLVNGRLVRAQRALDRAVAYTDDDMDAKALSALYKVRLQMKLAWRAAKYVIDTAPPPAPPGDGVLHAWGSVSAIGHVSGTGGGGGAIADQFTTAGAVLALQHTVAETAVGMIDTAHGTLRDSLSRTIFAALNQRDTAVDYIHSIDVPPPVGDGAARVTAARRVSGGLVGGTWATVMPPVSAQIADEVNQIQGALGLSSTMGPGLRGVLKDAEFQDIMTQRAVDQYWPPVVGDG